MKLLAQISGRQTGVWTLIGALFLVVGATLAGVGVAVASSLASMKILLYVCGMICILAAASLSGHLRLFLICLLVVVIPLRLDVRLATIGSKAYITLTAPDACLIAIALLWILELVSGKRPDRLLLGPFFAPALFLFVAVVLSLISATSKAMVVCQAVVLFKFLLFLVVLTNNILDRRECGVVIGALMVSLWIGAVSVLISSRTGVGWSSSGDVSSLAMTEAGFARSGGALGSSGNAAADFLAPLLIICGTYLLFLPGRLHVKLVLVLTMGVGLTALVATLSRGGWMSFALGAMMLTAFVLRERSKVTALAIVLMPMVVMVLYFVFYDTIAWRFSSAEAFSGDSRTPLMRQALMIIADHPFTGVGAGNYAAVMWHYPLIGTSWQFVVHNAYLLFWAECGTLGFMAFLWLFGAWGITGLKCASSRDVGIRVLGVGAVCALATQAVHMFLEPLRIGETSFVALLACLAVCARGVVRSKRAIREHVPSQDLVRQNTAW